MQVHIDTLQITEFNKYGSTATVEITIGNDRRRVDAYKTGFEGNEHLIIHGLAVRFQTGAKVWPGHAIYWLKSGNVNNLRPNIDKRGHVNLVGYAEDYDGKSVRSQHNAVA